MNSLFGTREVDNVITVGKGGNVDCRSTSEAFAKASDAAIDKMYTVLVYPGSTIDHTNNPYINVIPVGNIHSGASRDGAECPPCPWTPARLAHDKPLVALIWYDGRANICNVPAGANFGADVSPLCYLAKAAFPFTIGVVASHIGETPTWTTANQLLSAARVAGVELLNHSYTHGEVSTPADIIKEVIGARDVIEAAEGTAWDYSALDGFGYSIEGDPIAGSPNYSLQIGEIVRGWGWPGNLVSADPKCASKLYTPVMRLVRQTHQYATDGCQVGNICHTPARYHSSTQAMAASTVQAGCPKLRAKGLKTLLHTEPVDGSVDWAAWKVLVDYLIAARDAGYIELVTVGALMNGISTPCADTVSWGGSRNGDFEHYTADDVIGTGVEVKASGGDTGLWCRIAATKSLTESMAVEGGQTYQCKWKAIGSAASQKLSPRVWFGWYDNTTPNPAMCYGYYTWPTRTLVETAMTTNMYTSPGLDRIVFRVPRWAQFVTVLLTAHADNGENFVYVDDIQYTVS